MSGLHATDLRSGPTGGGWRLEVPAFSAARGSVTGLIGPNGAGKSTLLRLLAGLLPGSGRLTLDGQPLPPAGSRARARLIGYLPQSHEVQWPLRVRDVVALGRLPHRDPLRPSGTADAAAVARALTATDVAALAGRPVTTLSGGERARVMLARVLAAETPLLLADEPVAALDPAHQVRLLALLRRQAEKERRAVVVVLHDLTLAARTCDALVLLDAGRVVSAGPAAAVLVPDLLRRVYGVPFQVGSVAGAPVIVAGS